MKKVLFAMLLVSFISSACFAANAGRFGLGLNSVLGGNILVAEMTHNLTIPTVSAFYQFNDRLSVDVGYGASSYLTKDDELTAISNLSGKLMYNIWSGKSSPHIGLVLNSLLERGNSDKATLTMIDIILGGEVSLSDNASLLLDVSVFQSISSNSDPGSSGDYNGTSYTLMPEVSFRWYI